MTRHIRVVKAAASRPPRARGAELSAFTPEQQAEIAEMIRASETPLREALFRAAITLARALKPDLAWERLKESIDE